MPFEEVNHLRIPFSVPIMGVKCKRTIEDNSLLCSYVLTSRKTGVGTQIGQRIKKNFNLKIVIRYLSIGLIETC